MKRSIFPFFVFAVCLTLGLACGLASVAAPILPGPNVQEELQEEFQEELV